ncbi:MAG TPA: glycosyltransferase [Acidimicrobiales bacterium]
MFTGLDEPIHYQPPWDVPFALRRSWLEGAGHTVAYLYELEDTSTFRYRVFNMVESLRSDPGAATSASWFTRREYRTDQSFIDRCDTLVICRTRYDDAVARLVERARARGVTVLFDVDDFVIDPHYTHFILDALGVSPEEDEHWDYWFSYIGRLRATLDLCDGAIATNRTLADRIERATGGLPCGVIPNFLNRRQTEVSDLVRGVKRANGHRRDGRVLMGYLSGSPTHARDFELASPALADAMRRHEDLDLRIVGFMEMNSHLEPFAGRIERVPLQDYCNLQRMTAACEFCLVPLAVNHFTECKSELKFFEAGIVGCPVVATPTPAYADAITDGVDGLLAATYDWPDKVEAAYDLAASDGPEYRAMCAAALRSSRDRYAWDAQADLITKTVDTLRVP